MATYTIEIDDSLIAGLQDTFETQNAQRRMQRKPPLADIAAMLTEASIGLANQGLNAIYQAQANTVVQALARGKSAAEAAALIA